MATSVGAGKMDEDKPRRPQFSLKRACLDIYSGAIIHASFASDLLSMEWNGATWVLILSDRVMFKHVKMQRGTRGQHTFQMHRKFSHSDIKYHMRSLLLSSLHPSAYRGPTRSLLLFQGLKSPCELTGQKPGFCLIFSWSVRAKWN